MNPLRILETSLYADDLDAAEAFYGEVLALEVHSREAGRHVFFRCHDGMLLIFAAEATSSVPTTIGGARIPLHGARGAGHVAFAIDADAVGEWRDRLARYDVAVESEVEWPGGGRSLYFRDPAGNSLEVATPALWDGIT